MDWSPIPGETLQLRTGVAFATGMSPLVEGKRWFRDTDRRDIQHELSGWPEGPTFTLNSDGAQVANLATKGLFAAIPMVLNILTNLSGTGGSPYGHHSSGQSQGDSQEPENEVEDFPVMWAAPDTIARTLPWQLDPARRPHRNVKSYETEVALTDRRLLFLGAWPGEPASVLWESPRGIIADATVMEFSAAAKNIRITFTDGSWVRLSTNKSKRMVNILKGLSRVMSESELTPGQRQRVAEHLSRLPAAIAKAAESPVFTRLPSGVVLGEVSVPKKSRTYRYLMGEDGKHASAQPGDY
jgi:hypothetical protein